MIISEGMHESAAEDIPTLLTALRGEIGALGFTCSQATILTASKPRFDFPEN
jgi:hypothetical protein